MLAQISQSPSVTGFFNNNSTVTIPFNNATGANKVLIVGVTAQQPGAFVTGVTYNGIPLTSLVNHFNPSQTRVNIWYLVNPPVGNFNVVVNNSQSDNGVIGVTSFSGVDQTSPFGPVAFASGSSSAASVNISSAQDQLIYSLTAFNNGTTHTFPAGQTSLWNSTINSSVSGSASVRLSSGTSTTMTANSTSAPWSTVGVAIRPATAQSPTVSNFTTPGTFTFVVPAGVTGLTVEAWGAGGGGGGISGGLIGTRDSRGGGGGAYARSVLSVNPGEVYTVVVGAPGSGGAAGDNNGTNGGFSSFGSAPLVRAAGGLGGASNTSGAGGVGGSTANSIGSVLFPGGNGVRGGGGGAGSNGAGGNANNEIGGNGAAVGGGNGGTAPNSLSSSTGNSGNLSGGGGSGARSYGILGLLGAAQSGGNGANGRVLISYSSTVTSSPGGVAGNILWLKADFGTNTTSNGAAVNTWLDASGSNANATSSTNQPQFRAGSSAQGINFNPSVSFNGTSNFFNLPTGFNNFTQGVSAFSVVNTNFGSTTNWSRIFHLSTSGNFNMVNFTRFASSNDVGVEVTSGTPGDVGVLFSSNSILSPTNGTGILGYRVQGGTSGQIGRTANVFSNGLSIASSNALVTPSTINRTNNRIGSGGAVGGNEFFNGFIPEIILYNRDLTANERLRINSYLAIKYGVTLSQATPQNYLAADGSTIFWNATSNASHNNNIAGIGRDDVTSLNQKQSRSINPGFQITIGNGNTISSTNQANSQVFDLDRSAMLWGDNNGAVNAWTSLGAPAGYQLLPRNWKIQETGQVGSVKVRVGNSSSPNGLPDEASKGIVLLVSNSSNFSSPVQIVPMTLVGDNWEADFDFSNGQYFTFATCEVGPVSFVFGSSSERCQGNSSVIYSANALNASSFIYSLDEPSLAGGNTINSETGEVFFSPTWSGTSVITARALGCTEPEGTHTIQTIPSVSVPVFNLGGDSQRCRAAGSFTYTATAANSTGISYSLDASSLAAGNTINASTGLVTFAASWSGTSIVTATATGCNGPVTSTHTITTDVIFANDDSFMTPQGSPIAFNVLANDLCNINPNSVTIVQQPVGGFLQTNVNGQMVYVSFGSFLGQDEFVYQVCSNSPVECRTATVVIDVTEVLDDPCFEANQAKTYFLPFPENNTQLRQSLLSAASVNLLTANVRNIVSISIPYPRTVIIYDHWEDGYETDITNPQQSTTQVWGDGDLTNGVAPGYPDDLIPPGGFITLDNSFPWNRPTSTIVFDGKDKIYSTANISVSKVTGDAGFSGPTPLFDVQNVKTNVSDNTRFGQFFVLPFGENVTAGPTTVFRYTGLFVRASEDGTIVELDYDGNGTFDVISPTLNQGEVWFYNGTGSTPGVASDVNNANDIKAGARLRANKDVGVDLVFGGIDSYGTRNIPVLPSQFYGPSYFSPVYSTNTNAPVVAYFVNPNSTPITINWRRGTGGTGSFEIPANNGIRFFNMNIATGTRFWSAGGESFTAVGIVDADNDGAAFDWAFNMIPESRLSSFATLAWAPGSSDGSGNFNPVWVTPAENTTIYVKYDGNVSTGPFQSPCGAFYDVSFSVNALQAQLIFGLNNDNSGIVVYNCDDVPMASVWGQRPFGGTPAGNPAIDVGYTMEPKCLTELVFATDDRTNTTPSTPIDINVLTNDGAFLTLIDPLSVAIISNPSEGTVTVNLDGTIRYTPRPGFIGEDSFQYQVCAQGSATTVCDIARVFVVVSPATIDGANTICGNVFGDFDLNGIPGVAEEGIGGIEVQLFRDLNRNGILDAGEPLESTTLSSTLNDIGYFQFILPQDSTYRDQFDVNGSATGSNGTINWINPWVKIEETNGFGSGNVRVANNRLEIRNQNRGARRTFDLSRASTSPGSLPIISFDYQGVNLDNQTTRVVLVEVAASANPASWTQILSFNNNTAQSFSFTIPASLVSSTTTVRFRTINNAGMADNGRGANFDNVQIRYFSDVSYILRLASPIIDSWQQTTSPAFFAISFDGVDNASCDNVFGLAKADLEVTKIVDNPSPNIGDVVNFEIMVLNNGPANATGITLTDLLPNGLDYVMHEASQGSYSPISGLWSTLSLDVGEFSTLSVSAIVTENALPSVTNSVVISASDVLDPNSGNNSASALVVPLRADLQVVKSVNNAAPNVGDVVTFSILVQNLGPNLATEVFVSDVLPSNLVYVSDNSGGAYDPISGIWNVGDIPAGSSTNLLINVEIIAETLPSATNLAEILSSATFDTNPSNNQDNQIITPLSADFSILKTVDVFNPNVGEDIVFTLTASNAGPSGATNVVVTDQLPSGYTFVNAIASVGTYDEVTGIWTIGSLANGGTATLEITATVLATGDYTNIASITATEFDPTPGNNTSEVTPEPVNVLVANNDTAGPINGLAGASDAGINVLDNDTLNGVAV
ncbi:Ig-like domain-containing protein, partial [Mongoliitalea lutea]